MIVTLNPILQRLAERRPIPVMARGILERCLNPAQLDAWFGSVAEQQYTRTLLFSVVSLSFRDEHPHFSDTLAFSMEVMVPSRKSAWTGKRCIVQMIGASITENLLKLHG
jgi:hypothetical protein